jgi:hypothetical protein
MPSAQVLEDADDDQECADGFRADNDGDVHVIASELGGG